MKNSEKAWVRSFQNWKAECHAKEIKAGGAKYCDCPACAAAEAILAKKADMLK